MNKEEFIKEIERLEKRYATQDYQVNRPCFGTWKELFSHLWDYTNGLPIKTRQDKFLEKFPDARLLNKILNICPRDLGKYSICPWKHDCEECKKEYWSKEI